MTEFEMKDGAQVMWKSAQEEKNVKRKRFNA